MQPAFLFLLLRKMNVIDLRNRLNFSIMKQLLVWVLIAFLTNLQFNVKAQPTLTAANTNVMVGEQFNCIVFNTTASNFNAGLPAGSNLTWNFNNLDTSYWPPIQILFQPQIPIGNYAFQNSNAVILLDDEYDYLKTNSDSVLLVGYHNHFTEFTEDYYNPVKKLQYPFTFNNSFTDNFSGQAWGMVSPFSITGNITVTADGYGTLVLPSGTVNNVLRVRSVKVTAGNNSIDSATILDWYLAGVHVPILKLTKVKYTLPNYNTTYY
jgi:hypothetical protein